jgi:hypothetical protein
MTASVAVVEKAVLANPVPAAPVPPKPVVYEPKPLELSKKGHKGPKELGMNKSKKPWKILSSRSLKHKKINPKKWQQ